MQDKSERTTIRALRAIAIALCAIHLGCAPVSAEVLADAGPARNAIALLTSFPVEVDRISTTLEHIPVPSGRVIYTCTYPPAGRAVFYVKDHVLNYSSKASFPELNLRPKVQPVQTATKQFADKFTPILRQWSQTTLPRASAAFSQAANEVHAVQDEINQGIGPNESQRARVISALTAILSSLDTGKAELTEMTRIMSEYHLGQQALRESLSQWSVTASPQVRSFTEKTREEINRQRCKGDGLDKLGSIEREANASIAAITSNIDALQQRTDEANKALPIVIGAFVSYAARYEAVAERLKVVQESPVGSVIQNLHLVIATKTWQDFVNTAQQ